MSSRIATGNFPGAGALSSTGKLFALGLDVVVGIFQRPFQTREFVEQCWFALNDPYHGAVVDISESGTGEGNPVISFSWNGGANQIWRAQWLDHPAAADAEAQGRTVQGAGKFAGQCER